MRFSRSLYIIRKPIPIIGMSIILSPKLKSSSYCLPWHPEIIRLLLCFQSDSNSDVVSDAFDNDLLAIACFTMLDVGCQHAGLFLENVGDMISDTTQLTL